jgi:membrane protease YdiL (CAAX protease family)
MITTLVAAILGHLLAAYAVLAAPWLGRLWYEKARRKVAAGLPNAKVDLYRQLVVEQIVGTSLVAVIWRLGAIPENTLGLVAPRHWGWNLAATLLIVGPLLRSALKLRSKADKIRKKLEDMVGALLPNTHRERVWFGGVSVGAGISEELVFRGFLFYYFGIYVPRMNTLEKVLVISVCFGLAHLYQGWQGMLGTGIVGLAMGGLYIATGSLLMPMVVHAAIDWRALLMLPPQPPAEVAQEVGV